MATVIIAVAIAGPTDSVLKSLLPQIHVNRFSVEIIAATVIIAVSLTKLVFAVLTYTC